MQIELNQSEIETINEALEAWQHNEGRMIGSLIGAMLGKGDPGFEAKMREREKKDEEITNARKIKATILRAKLMQASLSSVTTM